MKITLFINVLLNVQIPSGEHEDQHSLITLYFIAQWIIALPQKLLRLCPSALSSHLLLLNSSGMTNYLYQEQNWQSQLSDLITDPRELLEIL